MVDAASPAHLARYIDECARETAAQVAMLADHGAHVARQVAGAPAAS